MPGGGGGAESGEAPVGSVSSSCDGVLALSSRSENISIPPFPEKSGGLRPDSWPWLGSSSRTLAAAPPQSKQWALGLASGVLGAGLVRRAYRLAGGTWGAPSAGAGVRSPGWKASSQE